MMELRATLPCAAPPAWAVLERHLFLESTYPGPISDYAEPEALRAGAREARIDAENFQVTLPPATQITLQLGTARWANRPSCGGPWPAG